MPWTDDGVVAIAYQVLLCERLPIPYHGLAFYFLASAATRGEREDRDRSFVTKPANERAELGGHHLLFMLHPEAQYYFSLEHIWAFA